MKIEIPSYVSVVMNVLCENGYECFVVGGAVRSALLSFPVHDYDLTTNALPEQMKQVFPELDFIELPFSHPIYHQKYHFPNGLPKIHEHDNLPPRGYGLIWQGRLVCFFSWECDLGDGWEDPDVHNDSQPTRQKAFQMGENILQYVFTH